MLTATATTPEQQLEIERTECVCRECGKQEGTKRMRNYCAACGEPRAWRTHTTSLPLPGGYMTDEQIAREFLRNVRDQRIAGVAEAVLIAIIGEARATERTRCLGIVAGWANDDMLPGPVQQAARNIRDCIAEG